jgi:hypothetical protein
LELYLNGLQPFDLGCRARNDNAQGNHFLGIMPYDNRLERSEYSAITYWANIYAK